MKVRRCLVPANAADSAQIVTPEEMQECENCILPSRRSRPLPRHSRATYRGAAEGLAGSSAFALPAAFLLNRNVSWYRALPMSIKSFSVLAIILPAIVIRAEIAGMAYDRSRWCASRNKESPGVNHLRVGQGWAKPSLRGRLLQRGRTGIVSATPRK